MASPQTVAVPTASRPDHHEERERMVTYAENELLNSRRGRRADGSAAQGALLDPGVALVAARGRRRPGRSGFSGATTSRSVPPTVESGSSTRRARTAGRRWCSPATRSAGCVASSTAGRSTWRGRSSTSRPTARTRRRSPPRCPSPTTRPSRVAASSGSGSARARPHSSRTCRSRSSNPGQVWVTITKAYCNWLQGVEATLDSAHVGTLHSAYVGRSMPNAMAQLGAALRGRGTPYGLDGVRVATVARRQHLPAHHEVGRSRS